MDKNKGLSVTDYGLVKYLVNFIFQKLLVIFNYKNLILFLLQNLSKSIKNYKIEELR